MKQTKAGIRAMLLFLKGVLDKDPDMSGRRFDKIPHKPCTERAYRHVFGSWEKAKFLACQPGVSKVAKPKFNVEREKQKQIVAELKAEVKYLKKELLMTEDIRKYIFELRDKRPKYPTWLLNTKLSKGSVHGVPTLLLSDWHFGEVIKAQQVFGVNEFNDKVEDRRVRTLAQNAVDICTVHLPSKYPGLVLLLNGDFVSGTIHDELIATSEKPIMPVVLKVYTSLKWFIDKLKQHFPKIAIFCCPGNHSRITKKPVYKDKALTTYDWLIYSLLEKHFEGDARIHFEITPGDDIQFKIYNHVYRMTHGAQFRGGQGFMGHVAPVTRGEIRKRSSAESYNRGYDTLVIGHFHSYGWFRRSIINGSLVGFGEFSLGNNYLYERPQQALWITHPEHGITFRVPIFCTKKAVPKRVPWVTWRKE
jgi:hypothetical protein